MTRGDAVRSAALVATLVLGGYAALRVVLDSPDWLRIGVWFAAAIVAHDLVAYPLYSLADRLLRSGADRLLRSGADRLPRRAPRGARALPLGYLRAPAAGSLLLLAVFWPQIGGGGNAGFSRASGLSPGPALTTWLLTAAGLVAVSAGTWLLRSRRARGVPPA